MNIEALDSARKRDHRSVHEGEKRMNLCRFLFGERLRIREPHALVTEDSLGHAYLAKPDFSTVSTQIHSPISDDIVGVHRPERTPLGIGQSRCRSFAFEGIKQMLPVGDSEFGEGRVEVALDRPNRHRKLSGNLRVSPPGRRQHGGLTLTSR